MRKKRFLDLELSEMGIGTYLGELDEDTDNRYMRTIRKGIEKGTNVIDTAINYRYMKSERVIGKVLKEIERDRVFVATKGGYIPFDAENPEDPKTFFEETFLKTGIVDTNKMTPQGHYIGREFIDWAFHKSLENLGTDYIDLYYIHNPEEQLLFTEKEDFYNTLRECFSLLEEKVKEGKLRYYGLATWHGFRVPRGARQHLDLEEIISLATEVGGEDHHFRFIQLPYSLAMHEAFSLKNQEGGRSSTLETAGKLGIYVFTSAPLMQSQILGRVSPRLKEFFGSDSDLQIALDFVRGTPGVGTFLVGTSREEHLEANLKVVSQEPPSQEKISSLFKGLGM